MISLVVDDDPSVRTYIASVLRRENFETLEAEGGRKAFEIVQKLGGKVDLIVTDIQMPDGDGITFANSVRMLFPSIPILIVSGCIRPNAEFEFVEKPFSAATMLNVVRRVFGAEAKSA